MATHSIILARETPWTEEPGGLQTMGSLKCQIRVKLLKQDYTTSSPPLPFRLMS